MLIFLRADSRALTAFWSTVFLGLAASLPTAGSAQIWVQQFGTAADDSSIDIGFDNAGSLFVAGHTDGNLAGANLGSTDLYLQKFSSNGSLLWQRQFGTAFEERSEFAGMTVDSSGNPIVTSSTQDQLNTLVYKYDTHGNLQWSDNYGGEGWEFSRDVVTDTSNNVYHLGDIRFSGAGGTRFFAKYNAAGQLQWTKDFGGAGGSPRAIDIDSVGNLYVSGQGAEGTNSHWDLGTIGKYDQNGDQVWVRGLGEYGVRVSNSVAVDKFGSVFVVGESSGPVTSLLKFDSDGNFLWQTRFGGHDYFDLGRNLRIVLDENGDAYVSGDTIARLTDARNRGKEIMINKIRSNGDLIWTTQFGTRLDETNTGLAIDQNGSLAVSGSTLGSFDGFQNQGNLDSFIAKINVPGSDFDSRQTFLQHNPTALVESFESLQVDNQRNTTGISFDSFEIRSMLQMGVFGQMPDGYEGTFATDGDNWLVSPDGSQVRFDFADDIVAFGVELTGFGNEPLEYSLTALVEYSDGDRYLFSLAEWDKVEQPDDAFFWGIAAENRSIHRITFKYGNDTIGFDRVYLVHAVPEPSFAVLLLCCAPFVLLFRRKTAADSKTTQAKFHRDVVCLDNKIFCLKTNFPSRTLPCISTSILTATLFFSTSHSSAQNTVWERVIGTSGIEGYTSIVGNNAGEVYIGGSTTGSIEGTNFGNQSATQSTYDQFVTKYDDAGNVLWTQQFGWAGNDFIRQIALDKSENLFVGGTRSNYSQGTVSKFDRFGNNLWTQSILNTNPIASGSVIVTGVADDSTGGVFALGTINRDDIFLTRFDTNGNQLWTWQIGNYGADTSGEIVPDSQGNVIISGWTRSGLFQQNATTTEGFIAKVDSSGSIVWQNQWGTDRHTYPYDIALDGQGNSVVVGNKTATEFFLTKFDDSGNLLWEKTVQNDDGIVGAGVWADADGKIYVAGSATGDVGGITNDGIDDVLYYEFDPQGEIVQTMLFENSDLDFAVDIWGDGNGKLFLAGQRNRDALVMALAVPEPGSHLILLSAVVGLFLRRRRSARRF